MGTFRTSNPALNKNTFKNLHRTSSDSMTIDGTVNKSFLLLAIIVFVASYFWNSISSLESMQSLQGKMIMFAIGGFVVALITIFKKEWSPITAPIYAGLEGAFLGIISRFFELMYPGIVVQAIMLTFGTLFILLLAYKSKLIQATENFRLGVVSATGAIAVIYLATFLLGLFGINIPFIHDNGLLGIGFSLFVVVIAALNLVLDFDFIEQGAEYKAPKYMEWYAAFGLIVTLVWLYLEILRLLAKLRSRR